MNKTELFYLDRFHIEFKRFNDNFEKLIKKLSGADPVEDHVKRAVLNGSILHEGVFYHHSDLHAYDSKIVCVAKLNDNLAVWNEYGKSICLAKPVDFGGAE
jgi:hypothetical protein